MTASSDPRNPVEVLAEEFLDRKRRGETPTLGEYLARYPDLADEIRDLFPALLMVEDLGEDSGGTTGSLVSDGLAAIGARLEKLGDYRILREIGRGGMGVVYEAEQEALGRRVALKILAGSQLHDPKLLLRFHREAKAAARLHHTNIVPVFGVGEDQGVHYYVMQFIQGLGLDMVLDEVRRIGGAKEAPTADRRPGAVRGRLMAASAAQSLMTGQFAPTQDHDPAPDAVGEGPGPIRDRPDSCSSSSVPLPGQAGFSSATDSARQYAQSVARIGVQVAAALGYAHGQGTLHRDIKPSNLLLDAHGTVWVTDFGLAKVTTESDLTHTGDIIGTIRYMAPERFQGKCDTRADVYALGLTLYELLAKRPAYGAQERNELIRQVTQEPPRRLRLIDRSIPRDLETVVHKAIERDPAHRYATAGALAEDLQRFVEGKPIRARRSSTVERTVKWARRRPAVAALLGSLVLITVLGFAGITWAWRAAETALQELKVRSYSDTIALAEREWRANHVVRVQERLEACPSDLRDWGWHCLKRLCRGGPVILYGPSQGVLYSPDGTQIVSVGGTARVWNAETGRETFTLGASGAASLAVAPDGRRLATGSRDATMRIWDMATGQELYPPLRGGAGTVQSVAFSPDGRFLASAGIDGRVRVWDAATLQSIRTLPGHTGEVCSVAFSPYSTRLASAGRDKAIRIWDVVEGQSIRTLREHTDEVRVVAYSPDGRRLASAGLDARVIVWDEASGRLLRTLDGHTGRVQSVAFSSDGRHLASASHDKSVKVWDVTTGREAITFHLTHPASGVAFHPGGFHLAASTLDGTVRTWDATPLPPGPTGQEAATLRGHDGPVLGLAYSPPDGVRIATCGRDPLVRIWDATTGKPLLALRGHAGHVLGVAYSPDGRHLASGGEDRTVRVWDATTGQQLWTFRGHADRVLRVIYSPSPDHRWLASSDADGTVRVSDAMTGEDVRTLRSARSTVPRLAFSPDGKHLALVGSALMYEDVHVLDVMTGRLRALDGQTGQVTDVAFSPDGRFIAASTDDRTNNTALSWKATTVRVWDATTGREVCTVPGRGALACVAFSPDSRELAAGGRDETVQVWDVATGQELFTLRGHTGPVRSVAYSPDGEYLASASEDQALKVWDAMLGREIQTLRGHAAPVTVTLFRPDGRHLASASEDRTVKVWDAPPRAHTKNQSAILTFRESRGVESLTYSPDGRHLALNVGDNTVRIRDATTGQEMPIVCRGHTGLSQHVAYSRDGRLIASASFDQTVRIWDATTGRELRTLVGHTNVGAGTVTWVEFFADGKRLASAGDDRTVRIWDVTTGKQLLELRGHTDEVHSLSISPDGRRIASASSDGTVRIWDAMTGQELRNLPGHTPRAQSVAFSPDGFQLASAGSDRAVRIWDTSAWRELRTLWGHTNGIWCVIYSPDGKLVASGGGDWSVRIWDAATGRELHTLRHVSQVSGLKFNPDGTCLAASTNAGTVKVWDATKWVAAHSASATDSGR